MPTASFDPNKIRHRAMEAVDAAHRNYRRTPDDAHHHQVQRAHHLYDHRLVLLDEGSSSTEANPRGRAECACGWATEVNGPDPEAAIAKAGDDHTGHVTRSAEAAGVPLR